MRLIKNLILVFWAVSQWAVFLFAMLTFLIYGTIIGGIMWMVAWGDNWILALSLHLLAAILLTAFHTYPNSTMFWALPFYNKDLTKSGD